MKKIGYFIGLIIALILIVTLIFDPMEWVKKYTQQYAQNLLIPVTMDQVGTSLKDALEKEGIALDEKEIKEKLNLDNIKNSLFDDTEALQNKIKDSFKEFGF